MERQPGRSMQKDVAISAVKAAPPTYGVWKYLSGLPLEKWLTAALIVYTVLQITVLVRNEFIRRKGQADDAINNK